MQLVDLSRNLQSTCIADATYNDIRYTALFNASLSNVKLKILYTGRLPLCHPFVKVLYDAIFAWQNVQYLCCFFAEKKLQPAAYRVCLYGVPLWLHYNAGTMAKFKYCFHKCLKRFVGFSKYYSVTSVLLELDLPSFDTVIHNYRFYFRSQWRQHSNSLIGVVRGVCHDAFS